MNMCRDAIKWSQVNYKWPHYREDDCLNEHLNISLVSSKSNELHISIDNIITYVYMDPWTDNVCCYKLIVWHMLFLDEKG